MLLILGPIPPIIYFLAFRSFRSGSTFFSSETRNSTLFLVVYRIYPPQYFSARAACSLIVSVARSLGEATLTVHIFSPLLDTWTINPGFMTSWYFQSP